MFPAAVLAVGLATLTPQAHPVSAPLMSQSQAYASTILLRQTSVPKPARKDHKWDGALGGAVAGAAGGALAGLFFYGRGEGEWPSMGVFVAGTTLYGTVIGGATGLVIDLIKR